MLIKTDILISDVDITSIFIFFLAKALNILKFSPKHASRNLEKLLLSAINNWEQKNDGEDATSANLIVKSINVDSARMLKRIQAAPQGRAHRIRKRSNHVTLIIDKA